MSDALKWVVAISPEPKNAEKVMAIFLDIGFRVLSQYGPRIGARREDELFLVTSDKMNQCANSSELIEFGTRSKIPLNL